MNRIRRGTMLIAALTIAAAACSRSPEPPPMADDLKQDLAKVGGSDMQLAGSNAPRVDIVSASERTRGATPAPRAPQVSRTAPTTARSAAPSAQPQAPQPAKVDAAAEAQAAPVQIQPHEEIPQPSLPNPARPQVPQPSTQREPRGGWKTPGEIIRRAPFPINP